ncbi:MAG TPA: hypothetical protein VIC56_03450 [Gemmatimonadota bacterium]
MHQGERGENGSGHQKLPRRDPEDVAEEDLEDVGLAMGRLRDQQDRHGRRHGVDDPHHRLLGHARRPAAHRQHGRPGQGEREREHRGVALDQEREGDPHGRDLREREVHEHDAPLDDVDAQVSERDGEQQAGAQRHPHEVELEEVHQRAARAPVSRAACRSASRSWSNRSK